MSKRRVSNSSRDSGMWSPIGSAVYEIYGKKYGFDIRSFENGGHFAWCKTVKKWAWLFYDRVLFENEGAILAKRVSFDLKK